MSERYRGNSMAEFEARQAGRYIAQFVPPENIQTATSIPEALLKAHVASEHTKYQQGEGTSTVEPHFIDRFPGSLEAQKRKMVEEAGKLGEGNLDVLRYRLNQVENGAGEYAAPLAHKLTTNHDVRPARLGTVMRDLEDVGLQTLHLRLGSNSSSLKGSMSDQAIEWRAKTHELTGDARDKYEIDGRVERIRRIVDSRVAIITGSDVSKILQDLISEGQYKRVAGYKHLVDLFTGTLKGAQERLYLDNKFNTGFKRP